MNVISYPPSYISGGLAPSRERDDFAGCGFISRVQGNFLHFARRRLLPRGTMPAQIQIYLPSAPFGVGFFVPLQLFAELQRP